MDVSEILKLLATLSIGLDDIDVTNPDDSDVVVFMRFINLAYFELLQATISESPIVVNLNEQLDCTNGVLSTTSEPIFIPKVIYNISTNSPLTGALEEDILKFDPGLKKTGLPLKWYYANGVINVYPLTTSLVSAGGGFGVRYIAQPFPLLYNSPSTDILIPSLYQQVLADGASYYVFQSETGFKDQNKMLSAQARWEDGKKKLFSYMKNISGKKILSTYSSV
ncbi:MAG: hypothetical protein QN834_09890 [Nitrososphaeraceae archaeon]|nr:hypothetical protein [Nitrososphaeraceae archaeon]